MNKRLKKTILITSALAASSLAGLIISGKKTGWGPFRDLFDWDEETDKVREKYDPKTNQGAIVFYGASNFRLWKQMEEDLKEYRVQNHGFGGSTDRLLIRYADKLLYPYNPVIVVFQTGSNDYVCMKGSDMDIAIECVEKKKAMFELFHEKLPEAKFIVMSGILMPGRDEYTPIVRLVNEALKEYCENVDWLYYVDSEDMTFSDGEYKEEYFIKDGIHLTHEARLKWRDLYIRPMLEKVIEENSLESVRK